jgi:hypothetical protein
MQNSLIAALSFVLITGCTTLHPSTEPVPAVRFTRPIATLIDGQWQGDLKMRLPLTPTDKLNPADPSDLSLRLLIDGSMTKILIRDGAEWIEVMPGKLDIVRAYTNAVIVGSNSQGTDTEGWIESWALVLTLRDDDSMLVEWTRAVNNLDPGPNALPTFSMGAVGILRRTHFDG